MRFALFFPLFFAGCQSQLPSPPLETFLNKIGDPVGAALREGVSQGARSYSVQASAQGINPKYVIVVEGKWVVGVEATATVGVEGVAGAVHVSTQGDDETQRSPYHRGTAAPRGTEIDQ